MKISDGLTTVEFHFSLPLPEDVGTRAGKTALIVDGLREY